MFEQWWQLPGPSRFVRRITTEMRDGRNIILCLPEVGAEGLYLAVRGELGEDTGTQWTLINAADEDCENPAEYFYQRFVPSAASSTIRNGRALALEDDLACCWFWITDVTPKVWCVWMKFLYEFEEACRARDEYERPLICIELRGEDAAILTTDEVCLAIVKYRGDVQETDALLYASELTYDRNDASIRNRLRANLIARLALWDPALAVHLSRCEIGHLLRPADYLREYAEELGWTHERTKVPEWRSGMLNDFGGEQLVHSAALIHREQNRELECRIWSAQVAVLFPYVELERRKLLDEYGRRFTLPFVTPFGQVDKLYDLEIGHIHSQIMRDRSRFSQATRSHVRKLKDIRNAISHLEVLDPHLLGGI